MTQQTQPAPRVHHFYVAIAKFLFHHPEYGIVSARDPIRIKDAERYGLSPLMLYGLTVAGLPIRWKTFTPADRPRSFRDVLLEAWRNAEGLRGRPDILRVNRHLSAACPGLAGEMAKIGVRVEAADAREKSLPASLRSAQDSSRWVLGRHDGYDRSLAGSIQFLCQYAQADHDFCVSDGGRGLYSRETAAKIRQWLSLPAREQVPTLTVSGGLDWEPGPWLSSWETSLPPDRPRYFDHKSCNGYAVLLTRENAPKGIVEDAVLWADSEHDNAVALVRDLVACWPNPPAEIAKCAGLTLRDLQRFTSGRASLGWHARTGLEALLGIEFDESIDQYVMAGPYTLVASKPLALKKVYEGISSGGNVLPCELVPRRGAADPNWRYVLINTYGKPPSIVLAPRGAKIAERLPNLLMNYRGIRAVAPEFYRDIVSTCARACREPDANIRAMKDFGKRHEAHWTDCSWLPE